MADRPPRKRILHVITRLEVAGAQDNTLLTCEWHDRERFEVELAAGPWGGALERAKRAVEHFHPLPHMVAPISPKDDLLALAELVSLLRRRRYDLVHLHSSKAGFLGRLACRITGTPCVFTYHGFAFHDFMPPWKRALYIGLERLAKDWGEYYATLSENDRREGIDRGFIPQDRSKVIYTGIQLSKFDVAVDREAKRTELGLGPDELGVVVLGRLDAQKAPDVMLDAFAQFARERPNAARLFFVGDGELREQSEARARALGIDSRVHFLGRRSDVAELLMAMDVFAFSSRWEAMGRAMLEAMICGLPVVAPAIYGIPEVVEHERTGYLYPVGEVSALAEGLRFYADQPERRRAIGKAASAFIRARFDHRAMVESVEAMFDDVLSKAEGREVRASVSDS